MKVGYKGVYIARTCFPDGFNGSEIDTSTCCFVEYAERNKTRNLNLSTRVSFCILILPQFSGWNFVSDCNISDHRLLLHVPFELLREKTGLRGFRPGATQTRLYSLRSRLEA